MPFLLLRIMLRFTCEKKIWYSIKKSKYIMSIIADPNIFLWIVASVTDAAAVNPNGIKTFLASGLSTFPIKGNPVFSDGPKSLPKNPPD